MARDIQAILREDMKRRNARRIIEDAILGVETPMEELSNKRGAYVNPCLVRGIGTVNPPLPVKASRDNWKQGRAYGIAATDENALITPEMTVRGSYRVIHADGTEEIRQSRKLRQTRTRTNTQTAHVPETARIKLDMDWSGDA